ncbi:hypothetical protein HPB52_022404 [Rhipicephalus sanguineus]|uniref:AMP-dependent synthetase/ligase domain-containing protein n=1 Tax=Rhipicephalus sanguineus TaxID=34632 RepID=A0A9D4T4U0_RHISA|nr:hypothetical protein HPB52_022404 [Rhipicephalus sanguineus]
MKARIEDNVIYSPYPDIKIPMCSFYTLAKRKLLTDPDKIALVSDGVSLTRAKLLAGMERYAVGLQQYGLLPGDRICVHHNNGVENLLVMYGCILAGATVVLAKTSLTENKQQREKGKRAISRQESGDFNFESNYTRVCANYFDASDIVTAYDFNINGDSASLKRDKPTLKDFLGISRSANLDLAHRQCDHYANDHVSRLVKSCEHGRRPVYTAS